jgi:hypothetical protein
MSFDELLTPQPDRLTARYFVEGYSAKPQRGVHFLAIEVEME